MQENVTATVSRKKGNQEDLPTITVSDRKIQELEDLGDALAEAEDAASATKERVKEANENLVAAMKKRERSFYSRKTWGSITLKDSKTTAKVKHASAASDVEDSGEE